MKTLAGMLLTSILLVGCSDSSTDSAPSNDSGNGSPPEQNSDSDNSSGSGSDDTGSSTGNDTDTNGTTGDATGSSDGSSDNGSSSDSNDTGNSSDSGSSGSGASEPEPATIEFTGDNFGYLRFNTNQYPADDPDYYQYTMDERVAYTVWAVNYVEAQSLLEAMHAINDYREDHQQIKIVNGGTQDLDSLIDNYCPASGARFAANRCEFYARLAYTKTMAQDGWQVEHRQNTQVPLMCGGWGIKFFDCRYSAMGNSRVAGSGYDGPSTGEIDTKAVSPIEAWQYEKNEPKITAINSAARSYIHCAMGEDLWESNWYRLRPTLSPWAVEQKTDQIEATQYGTLTVWIISDDTVEDVYTDVTAEHDGSSLCKAAFQLDLKDVQPNAKF